MFKFNRNTKLRCEICSKVAIKTPERRQQCLYYSLWTYFTPCFSISVVNCEQVNSGWASVYFWYWHWRVLLKVLQCRWCQNFQKVWSTSCALRSQMIRILAYLTRDFESHANLVLCIVVSYSKNAKFYLLDPFHLQRTNKLSKLNQSMSRQGQPGL